MLESGLLSCMVWRFVHRGQEVLGTVFRVFGPPCEGTA